MWKNTLTVKGEIIYNYIRYSPAYLYLVNYAGRCCERRIVMKRSKVLAVLLSACLLMGSMPVMAAEPGSTVGGGILSEQQGIDNPIEEEPSSAEDGNGSAEDTDAEADVTDEGTESESPSTDDEAENNAPAVGDGVSEDTPVTDDDTLEQEVETEGNEENVEEDGEVLVNDKAETVPFGAEEDGSVAINELNFPDDEFRSYVAQNFDEDNDGTLSRDECARVRQINISDNRNLRSVEGIRYFINLADIYCSGNKITELDLTGLRELGQIYCSGNGITELVLDGCDHLHHLSCANNKITELDVSALSGLIDLDCGSNELTELDVSKCTKLTSLSCGSNNLSSIDLSANKELTGLGCGDNQLSSLDVTGLTNLQYLYFGGNEITEIDLGNCSSLYYLECNDTPLAALDVSANKNLTTLHCRNIAASSLNVSGNPNLTQLECGGENLVSLGINDNLKTLSITNSIIEKLDLSNHDKLETIELYQVHSKLQTIDLTGCSNLQDINKTSYAEIPYPKLESVILDGCTSLTDITLSAESLEEIDVSVCPALLSLKLYDAPLIQLNVRKNYFLETLELTKDRLAEDFVLYCWANTPAEEYAKANGIRYESEEFDGYVIVSFVTNCDIELEPQKVIPGAKAAEPNLEPDDGSKVVGWFTDEALTKNFVFNSTPVTEDITLYAKLASNDKVYIDEETFPDEVFRNYLINNQSNYGIKLESVSSNFGNKNKYYLGAEARSKRIRFSLSNMDISSLQGIEYFEGLYELRCDRNQLTGLDLSKNVMLEMLECSYNSIAELKLPTNRVLKAIYCADNELSSLDARSCTGLRSLSCDNNNLSNINVSSCPELQFLYCSENELVSLDLSSCAGLQTVYCGNNQLTSLDVSHNTKLTSLNCSDNTLTDLNVRGAATLESLACGDNELTVLDIGDNAALTSLSCGDNQLSGIDVSNNRRLQNLSCTNNEIESLELSNNTELTYLSCGDNQLTSLDLSNNTELTNVTCSRNQLTTLDLKSNTKLTSLNCSGNQLSVLDVSNSTQLESLYCFNNELVSLDLRNNINLKYFDASNNYGLVAIDLRGNDSQIISFLVPDTVTVYCTEGTWIADYCKRYGIDYSYGDPSESGGNSPGGEDNPPAIDSTDLKDATVVLTATYIKVKKNNAAQKPVPKKVTLGGKTLKKGTDYTVSYEYHETEGDSVVVKSVDAITKTGTYQMVLTAKEGGKYTGSQKLTLVVTDKKLMSAATVKVSDVPYTGSPITSGVIRNVKHSGKLLTEGTDYTVSYRNNVNSGKGTVIITAKSGSEYEGVKEVTFNITGRKISQVKVSGVTAKDFNGRGNVTQNLPDITLTYTYKQGGQKQTDTLSLGTDFTVSYEKNNGAGTAKIVFTGRGLYNGTLKKNFKINKVKLANVKLDQTPIVAVHVKAGAKPDVTITYNEIRLVKGTDYTLSYKKNKAISSDTNKPTITVTGKGNYSGSLKNIPFTIEQKVMTDGAITMSAPDVAYKSNTSEYTTSLKVYDNNVILTKNKDYVISYENNSITALPESGRQTATVTITGIGNYDGKQSIEFHIVEKLLGGLTAKVTGKHIYEGSPVVLSKSEIVITDKKANHTLTEDEFEITGYSLNDRVGNAKVEVRGLGKYGGTKVITFKISRK